MRKRHILIPTMYLQSLQTLDPLKLNITTACNCISKNPTTPPSSCSNFRLGPACTINAQHGTQFAAAYNALLSSTVNENALRGCSAEIRNIITGTEKRSSPLLISAPNSCASFICPYMCRLASCYFAHIWS